MMNQDRLSREKEHIRKFRYDALRTENRAKPDYRKISERLLVDTPTQKQSPANKTPAYKELDEIQQAARTILDLGYAVSVPTDVSCCACAHLYSFYSGHSITAVDRWYVAIACLFLACKTEDYPRSINDLIIALYNLLNAALCKEALDKKTWYRRRMDEITANMNYHSPGGHQQGQTVGSPSPTEESGLAASPASARSIVSPMQAPFAVVKGGEKQKQPLLPTPNMPNMSNPQLNNITSPSPSSTHSSSSIASSNLSSTANNTAQHNNLPSSMSIPKYSIEHLKSNLAELTRKHGLIKTCFLSRDKKPREQLIPPDDFFHKTKPVIEEYEMVLLMTIGFDTIVHLPHPLIVDAGKKFQRAYGPSISAKIARIAPIAYELATRVVSLIPVPNQTRNNIAAALIYLVGPFRDPVDEPNWWKTIFGSNLDRNSLIKLAELLCDSWIATKDYFHQVHELPRKKLEEEIKRKRMEKGGFVSPIADRFHNHRSPSPGIPSQNHMGGEHQRRSLPPTMGAQNSQNQAVNNHGQYPNQQSMQQPMQKPPQKPAQNLLKLKQTYSPQSTCSGNSYSSNFVNDRLAPRTETRLNVSLPNVGMMPSHQIPHQIPPVPSRNPTIPPRNPNASNLVSPSAGFHRKRPNENQNIQSDQIRTDQKLQQQSSSNFTPPKYPATNDEQNPNGSKRHKHD